MGNSLVTGIDIGHHSIKAVVMKAAGDSYQLVSYYQQPLASDVFADNHTLDSAALAKQLKSLKRRLPWLAKQAAIAVPDNAVISKVLHLNESLESEETEFYVQQTFAQQSPFPIEDLNIDFVSLDQAGDNGGNYQVYATRKEVVESRVAALTQAGFAPLLVDAQAHSLLRVWQLAQQRREQAQQSGLWLLVDIGQTQTALCVAPVGHPVHCKEIAFGTESLSAAPASELPPLSLTPASEGEPPEPHINDSAEEAFIRELAQRLQRQVNLYDSTHPRQPLQGVWLCGGGATIEGLAPALTGVLELPVECLDPFAQVIFKRKKRRQAGDNTDFSAFGTAIGLAIRGIQWQRGQHVA